MYFSFNETGKNENSKRTTFGAFKQQHNHKY